MTVLREVLARFGIEADSGPLNDMDGAIGGVVGKLKQLGGALAGGFAVNMLKNWVMQMTNLGDEIAASSSRLGISTRALQQWRFAAKLSDLEAGALDNSLRLLQRNSFEAANGSREQAQAFRELGVDVRGADGNLRSIEQLLPELADGFKGMQDPSARTALAMQIFGRSGQQLVPLLSRGAEGIAELTAEFDALGGGGADDFIEVAQEMDDQMHRLDLAMFSLKSRIATVLIPIFTRMAEATTKFVAAFTELAKHSHIVQATLLVLGTAALIFGLKFLAGFAGPIAIAAVFAIAIAFIILLVDDLITLFSGGKSVIGGFIDELFGAGTAAEVVYELKEAWEGLVLAIDDAKQAVADFFGERPEDTARQRAARGGTVQGGAAGVRENVMREASRSGVIARQPGESMEDARARFERHQAEFAAEREAQRQAQVPARRGRQAQVPGGRQGGGNQVDARATTTIMVPPGTPRNQVEAIRQAVGQVMDERNRQAAAALVQEAVEE